MASDKAVFEQAMRDGNSAAWDQQWDKAMAAYRRALEEFPDDPNALSNLGLAFLATNQQEAALEVYQRASRLNPVDPVPIEKCGDILQRFGRLEEAALAFMAVAEIYLTQRDVNKAIENWSLAAQLVPLNLKAQSRLALAYERTNKGQKAATHYIAVARILQKQGQVEQALQAIDRAQALDPRNPDAILAADLLQRGEPLPEPQRQKGLTGPLRMAQVQAFTSSGVFAKREELSGETTESKAGTKSNPLESGKKVALTKLADLLFEIGNEDDSEKSRQMPGTNILKKSGTDPLRNLRGTNRSQIISHLSQGIDLHTRGDFNSAAAFYEKASRSGLNHAAVNYTLGTVYLDLERYNDSIKQFQQSAAHQDYAAGANFGLGLAFGRTGKMKEAVSHLLRCLQIVDVSNVPDVEADALSSLYETLQENVGRDQTEEQLTEIGESMIAFLSGADWEARVQEARRQLDSQQEDGALVPLAEMLSMPGADRVMQSMMLIDKYLAREMYQSAMDEAHWAIEYAPTYLPVHLKIADMLGMQNQVEAALAKYIVIADLYRIRGDASRAVKIFQQMARLAPLDLNVRTRLIDLLTMQGRTTDAIRQFIEAAEIHYSLADLERARQTYSQALLLAQRPNADRTWSLQILHRMGDIDIQRLDWRQALRVYEQIKTSSPNDEKARTTLIDLNFRLGQARQAVAELDDLMRVQVTSGNLGDAIPALEELARNHENELNIKNWLARAYQAAGRTADAIAQLDSVGEMYMQMGKRAEAIKTVQTIISLGPDNVNGYKQLLAELQSS